MPDKPIVRGPVDGNAWSVMAAVRRALRDAGLAEQVPEYIQRATSGDYGNLLRVSLEYVDFELTLDGEA